MQPCQPDKLIVTQEVNIIGGGLAGSEAAWQLARAGIASVIHEMRPNTQTEVHQTSHLAELVCSNSFRSDDPHNNAVGLLHEEMRRSNSLILRVADENKVPAGGALAVDREDFSKCVTKLLQADRLITIKRNEITELPPVEWQNIIVATGPLTSHNFSTVIQKMTGDQSLAFFDAIAPIVYTDSIDFNTVWFQSRYDKKGPIGSGKDYINCPMNREQYVQFIDTLLHAETGRFKEWEMDTPYFEGCLPIEVMASRGLDTLRYGPMKPVGLTNPRTGEKAHAVVQLRQDNSLGTLYNIVGFQTKLKHAEQIRVFKQIPGLESARFARLGGIHRNTFINSPKLLDHELRLKAMPRIRFAGQITGVEGYVESAAIGLLAGRFAAVQAGGEVSSTPPDTTALGSLIRHITVNANSMSFQPMNINFGLLPPIENKLRGRKKKKAMSERALSDFQKWQRIGQAEPS